MPGYVKVTDVRVNRYGFFPNQQLNISVNNQSPITISRAPDNLWKAYNVKNVQSLRIWVTGKAFSVALNEVATNSPYRSLIHGFYWTPFLHFF